MTTSHSHERIKVDRDFLVESLGGMHEVKKLGDQFGVPLFGLLSRAETEWVRHYTGPRKELIIHYTNYIGGVDRELSRVRPYPDITVKLFDTSLDPSLYRVGFGNVWEPVVSKSICSDIGYRQSRDQAKEYVRNWFHTEVVSILLEYVFI
jgi:hypothetical protein